jgi:hypothetical protein
MIMVTLCCWTWMYNIDQYVEQKLTLSSSFRCNQIYKCQIYYFSHTLLCYSSWTWMYNIDQYFEQKLMLNSTFKCNQIRKCLKYNYDHILLCYSSWTWMFNNPSYSVTTFPDIDNRQRWVC